MSRRSPPPPPGRIPRRGSSRPGRLLPRRGIRPGGGGGDRRLMSRRVPAHDLEQGHLRTRSGAPTTGAPPLLLAGTAPFVPGSFGDALTPESSTAYLPSITAWRGYGGSPLPERHPC